MGGIVKLLVFLALIAFSSLTFAQDSRLSPAAPQDKPISATPSELSTDGSEEGNFVGKFLDSYGSNGN